MMNQLVNTMKPNEQAYKQIKSAQSSNTIASIAGFVGGFMVGWSLGTVIRGDEPSWPLVGIGAGLIVVSIPLQQSFRKNASQAVKSYNRAL
jgi:hypothetical protein